MGIPSLKNILSLENVNLSLQQVVSHWLLMTITNIMMKKFEILREDPKM